MEEILFIEGYHEILQILQDSWKISQIFLSGRCCHYPRDLHGYMQRQTEEMDCSCVPKTTKKWTRERDPCETTVTSSRCRMAIKSANRNWTLPATCGTHNWEHCRVRLCLLGTPHSILWTGNSCKNKREIRLHVSLVCFLFLTEMPNINSQIFSGTEQNVPISPFYFIFFSPE